MKPELKKLLLLNLPYLLFMYLFAKCGQAYRLAAGADASAKLLHLTSGISAAFANPLPSLHPFDLCVGVAGAVAVRLIVYSKGKNAKKYRKGEEYGSARWGTAKDIAPYIDPKFENNILLTQTERLTMTGRPKDPKTARNKNVLVIGGSGSGKTRFYVKPNLMQCFPTSDYPTSFVVTDPKGTLVLETGQMFQRAGYRVKILNTINFSKSMKYNPFVYIRHPRAGGGDLPRRRRVYLPPQRPHPAARGAGQDHLDRDGPGGDALPLEQGGDPGRPRRAAPGPGPDAGAVAPAVRGHLLQRRPLGMHGQNRHQGGHGPQAGGAAGDPPGAHLLCGGQSERHPHAGRLRHSVCPGQLRPGGKGLGRHGPRLL